MNCMFSRALCLSILMLLFYSVISMTSASACLCESPTGESGIYVSIDLIEEEMAEGTTIMVSIPIKNIAAERVEVVEVRIDPALEGLVEFNKNAFDIQAMGEEIVSATIKAPSKVGETAGSIIIISSNGGSHTVKVRLKVPGGRLYVPLKQIFKELTVVPDRFNRDIEVKNLGGGTVRGVSLKSGGEIADWITFSSYSSSIAPNGAQKVTVDINVPEGEKAGLHPGTIDIMSDSGAVSIKVLVQLSPLTGIEAIPASLEQISLDAAGVEIGVLIPGDERLLSLVIKNRGTSQVRVIKISSRAGWIEASPNFEIAPGGQQVVYLSLRVPEDQLNGIKEDMLLFEGIDGFGISVTVSVPVSLEIGKDALYVSQKEVWLISGRGGPEARAALDYTGIDVQFDAIGSIRPWYQGEVHTSDGWVEVAFKVPVQVSPGTYHGQVIATDRNGSSSTVGLNLIVVDWYSMKLVILI